MFKLFTKKSTTFTVTYKFFGEDEIYTTTCTSCGLASLEADPCVEIISVA